MRYVTITAMFILLILSCKNSGSRRAIPVSDVHEAEVIEVLHTGNYTYLQVKENGKERWLAVPRMIASPGEVYYYRGGMEMEDFQSKELGRLFESVLFLEQVYTSSDIPEEEAVEQPVHTGVVQAQRLNFSIDPAKEGITISELYSGKKGYEGKTVKIRGAVTRFNPAILETNWIHIQDGTEHEGKFDLTVTSGQTAEPGEIIVVEGKITLDRDFGFGYFYEVLMEDATITVD